MKKDTLVLKIPEELDRGESFVKVLSNLVRARELTDSEFRTYVALLDFKWQNETAYPSINTLAKVRNKSRRTILYHIKCLVKKGFLSIKRDSEHLSNEYEFTPVTFDLVKKIAPVQKTAPPLVQKTSPSLVQKIAPKEDSCKKTKLKKTLRTSSKNLKVDPETEDFSKYDTEAVEYAKELDNLGDVKFYVHLMRLRDKGAYTDSQLQKALWKTKDELRADEVDGKKFWQKPGVLFQKNLFRIVGKNSSRNKKNESQTKNKF